MPLDRFLNRPEIARLEVLSITLKTVPVANVPVPTCVKANCALLLMVTPIAVNLEALAVLRFNTHL